MKNYACVYAKYCPRIDKDGCQGCASATVNATALKAEADMAARTSHDAVFALAMNHDPATLIVGNTRMKVLITDVDSRVSPECAPDIQLRCRVVDGAARASFADRFTSAERASLKRMIAADVAAVDHAIIRNKVPAGVHGGFTLPRNGEFTIDRVYFNDPVTVVLWKDGTKTIVRCQEGDTYSAETGLALCFAKKALGNKGNFNDVFKKHVPEEKAEETPVEEAAEPETVEVEAV